MTITTKWILSVAAVTAVSLTSFWINAAELPATRADAEREGVGSRSK